MYYKCITFYKLGEFSLGKTKGIAIRLDQTLYNKIEKHELSRSELIREAVINYFNKKEKPKKITEDIPEDIYNEIYNTVYNTEIVSLKEELKHMQKYNKMLEHRLNELSKDKEFMQNQIQLLTLHNTSNYSFLSLIKQRVISTKT